VQARDIAHEIVKSAAGNAAGRVHVNAVEALHYLGVIGNVEIGNDRLAEALDLDICRVVRADGNGGIDDVRDGQHDLADAHGKLVVQRLKLGKAVGVCLDLRLCLLGLGKLRGVLLRLTHELSDLFRQRVAACAQLVCLGHRRAVFHVKVNDLVHQRQLLVLKLLFDVFLYCIRVFADKFYIEHCCFSFYLIISSQLRPMRARFDISASRSSLS